MPRKARVEFDGAVYHLLDRGDRREAIFRDDRDREMFLATLGRVCEMTGWRVHAWVLAERNAGQNESLRRGWCLGGPSFRERTFWKQLGRSLAEPGRLTVPSGETTMPMKRVASCWKR